MVLPSLNKSSKIRHFLVILSASSIIWACGVNGDKQDNRLEQASLTSPAEVTEASTPQVQAEIPVQEEVASSQNLDSTNGNETEQSQNLSANPQVKDQYSIQVAALNLTEENFEQGELLSGFSFNLVDKEGAVVGDIEVSGPVQLNIDRSTDDPATNYVIAFRKTSSDSFETIPAENVLLTNSQFGRVIQLNIKASLGEIAILKI